MPARLRIAFVTETFPPEIGGAALCAGRFVSALAARGHSLEVVRPRQPHERGQVLTTPASDCWEELLVRGVPVPMHAGLQLGLPCRRRLLRSWGERRPDLVHVLSEGLLGRSAVRVARELAIPVTTSFHTNFHAYGEYYGLGWLAKAALGYLRRFHSRAACTLVPTEEVRQQLSAAGFQRLAVLGRGVDTSLFDPRRRSDELRRGWGAAPHAPVVLVVGRLAPEKNLELAVRAFLAAREAEPAARFVLVGDGPERSRLEALHPEFVFTGMLRGATLAAHYASADVFLFPSRTETFGNVVLEAMASGLAVLAFDEAAAHEHVRHQRNGMVVTPGDSSRFVLQAARLARDLSAVRRLGLAARQTALALSWEAVGDRLEEALRRAAAA